MDIMSGGSDVSVALVDNDGDGTDLPLVGTIAVKRYAAGWVSPEQVRVYQGGTLHLTLQYRGEGTLMLAIPSEQEGLWFSVGVRQTTSGYDYVPTEGVEVYVIDERPTSCKTPKQEEACWGVNRRATPYPLDPARPHSQSRISDNVGRYFGLGWADEKQRSHQTPGEPHKTRETV